MPWAIALIVACVAAAYSNSLNNAFVLDDQPGIVHNPYIRSPRFVPRYFVDPYTLTVNGANADYRPLVSLTYAMNYQVSGYSPWSWHVVNLLLHAHVAAWLFVVGRLLFGAGRVRPIAWLSTRGGDAASLIGACLFAVHPITSGVANYAWARSSLLVAALLMPATALLLRVTRDAGGARSMIAPAALYGLALLSKPEAIGFVVVAVLVEALLGSGTTHDGSIGRVSSVPSGLERWREVAGDRRVWRRLTPLFAIAAAYLAVRWIVMPRGQSAGWARADETPLTYLLTQTRAWWHYIGLALWPSGMVADDTTFPRVTDLSSSTQMMPVVGAIAGWLVALGLWLVATRRAPAGALLVAAYFIYLAPSSSVVPLAEMVNEHRPYFPISGLFLLAAVGALAAAERLVRRPVVIMVAMTAVVGCVLVVVTRTRNEVWRDDLTFWGDVVAKTPGSARGQMNHGIALMGRREYARARAAFEESARLAPGWHLPEINLGIVVNELGDADAARRHFDRAHALGPGDPHSYSYRGEFRRARGDLEGAIADFQLAAERATVPLRELRLLAGALIEAGRIEEAEKAIERGEALDRAALAEQRRKLDEARAAIMSERGP